MGPFQEITRDLELATRLYRDCKIILEVFLYLTRFSVLIIQFSQSTEISKKLVLHNLCNCKAFDYVLIIPFVVYNIRNIASIGLFQKKSKQESWGHWISGGTGERACGNSKGQLRKKWNFQECLRKNYLEFPCVLVLDLGISKGCHTILQNL